MPNCAAVSPPFSPISKSQPLTLGKQIDAVSGLIDFGEHAGAGSVEDIEHVVEGFRRGKIDGMLAAVVDDSQAVAFVERFSVRRRGLCRSAGCPR